MHKTMINYRVPYADTDQMGVVYYANFLVYFERARNEFLRDLGCTYIDFEASGFMLPVAEAHCFYKKPAAYDDFLQIYAWCEEFKKRSRVIINCEVKRDDITLARGYTVHACVSISSRKPVKIPDFLVNKITTFCEIEDES